MSKNAQRFDRRNAANASFTAGYDIVSVAGVRGLIARAHAEKAAVEKTAGKFQPAFTISRTGLEALSEKGIKIFGDTYPGTLPWNLYKNGPAGQGYYKYNIECTREQRDALVEAHARFSGWMKAAASLPLLAKAIGQSVSHRGEGSHRTYVSLWKLTAKYPSPHRLQRRIGAVQRRAVEILAAYDGRGCTLRSTLIALEATGSVGKAAVIAAYRSMTGKSVAKLYRSDPSPYKQARKALVELHT